MRTSSPWSLRRWPLLVVAYVFGMFFIVGIAVHRDYGVSFDEPAVRKFGNDAFAYLFQHGSTPTEIDWHFFNPVVQVIMRGVEMIFGLKDGADIWFMRHLLMFFLFFTTIVLFFDLARRRFNDWKLPLIGSMMLMLSPRLFAHGFYNPKDIPAMFFFALSVWTLVMFLEKKSLWRLLLHILCTALLISVRMFGLLMPILAIGVALLQEKHSMKKIAPRLALMYGLALLIALFLIWPMLWSNPTGLLTAFWNTTTRLGGGFYMGRATIGAGVPWHYLPVWIGITTPIIYSLLFCIGFTLLVVNMIREPLNELREKPIGYLAFFWFFFPVFALMTLPIGIFDEWRHMLFLYPAFLLIALEGMHFLLRRRLAVRWIASALLGIQMFSTGLWMAHNHPFEYAYFSVPTQWINGRFELDYWGLSYRAGLEWIIANDKRDHINVYVAQRVGKAAADTLPLADWNRLYFVGNSREADYILDTFREHVYRQVFPTDRTAYAVMVDGIQILAVYKGPDTKKMFDLISW